MGIISTVEDAIIAEIKTALMPAGNSVLREVKSLPGAWSYDLLKQVLQKAPAVYVAFLGGQGSKPNGDDALINARIDVYAVTKNAAGEDARRRGDKTAIGAYEILETVIPRLHGFNVPDIGSLKLINVDNLFGEAMFDMGGTVYAATFELPNLMFPFVVDLAALSNFETYHAEHSMAPGPDEPDAIDNVDMPQ